MSYPIPDYVYAELERDRDISGAELARRCDLAGRTARRYRREFLLGRAEPVSHTIEKRVTSARMEEYHEAQETLSAQDFLKIAPQLVREAQARNPVITHDTFTFDENAPIAIMFVSCMHLGGRYTKYELFQEMYEKLLGIPRLFWASLGDDIEGYIAQFRDVSAIYSQFIQVPDQLDVLREVLYPLAHSNKLLLGCGSQHGGKWLNQRTGDNPVKDIYLNELDVPFFDGVGYAEINVGEQTYHVAFSHELDGNSQWNPLHAQSKSSRFRFPSADVVVQGDKHTPAMQLAPYFIDEYRLGLRETPDVWLLQAGTAKVLEDPYTIQRWPTGKFGWPIAVFFPDRHEVKCTLDIEDAKLWLQQT